MYDPGNVNKQIAKHLRILFSPQRPRVFGEEFRFPRLNNYDIEQVPPIIAHQVCHALVPGKKVLVLHSIQNTNRELTQSDRVSL